MIPTLKICENTEKMIARCKLRRHCADNFSELSPARKPTESMIQISLLSLILATWATCIACQSSPNASQGQFPGVARELASFCAARPSLPIDLASMVVHVKRNTTFNYKLYLFSNDHIFQTGQVIPRADFRIHSFPVKIKHINEFWPQQSTPTFSYNNSELNSKHRIPSSSFNLRQFFKPVALNPFERTPSSKKKTNTKQRKHSISHRAHNKTTNQQPEEWDALPGDHNDDRESPVPLIVANSPQSRLLTAANHPSEHLNKLIHFDRDDQVSTLQRRTLNLNQADNANGSSSRNHHDTDSEFVGDSITPVGSFSSFHLNISYLVRKDFDQLEPQIVQIQLDAQSFQVSQVSLISDGIQNYSTYPQNEDYSFLSHKLLRDPNTRITAINQIYEDWITRNFYTIVYVQRRAAHPSSFESPESESFSSENRGLLINDRLVFRGSSIALLGADQLDYSVRAAAFITEKNGLHYYLEFLGATNKFHLCAVDWSRRPFKMIDSRQFPIKATKTQLDNEELLLCPPAVCYSNQPVDEIISYGRISTLSDELQRQVAQLTSTSSSSGGSGNLAGGSNLLPKAQLTVIPANVPARLTAAKFGDLLPSGPLDDTSSADDSLGQFGANSTQATTNLSSSQERNLNYLDTLFGSLKLGAIQLETKLHLRDWVWSLTRSARQAYNISQSAADIAGTGDVSKSASNGTSNKWGGSSERAPVDFHWRYELARRNDIKVKPDTYGYVLTGHEIDASYRVYNELYIISANHLITINYTLTNETVTSSHPISEEYPGLSSTLIDPITGAFYDRFANQIYFFKGDRYVGYDYATKKPLEDFQLQAPGSIAAPNGDYEAVNNQALVTSLPVVGILGRQHHVDGIYHDFSHDLVFIFTGMKFYSFEAHKFKDGIFKISDSDSLAKMRCINLHFLSGCRFDQAYPNPCSEDDDEDSSATRANDKEIGDYDDISNEREENAIESEDVDLRDDHIESHLSKPSTPLQSSGRRRNFTGIISPNLAKDSAFTEEQQMKLRSIASRGGLLHSLARNALLHPERAEVVDPLTSNMSLDDDSTSDNLQSRSQEAVIIYLLIAMIGVTIIISVAMIVALVNWSRPSTEGSFTEVQLSPHQHDLLATSGHPHLMPNSMRHLPTPSTGRQVPNQHHYMANQHQHYSTRRQLPSPQMPPPPIPTQSVGSSYRHEHNFSNYSKQSYAQQQPSKRSSSRPTVGESNLLIGSSRSRRPVKSNAENIDSSAL